MLEILLQCVFCDPQTGDKVAQNTPVVENKNEKKKDETLVSILDLKQGDVLGSYLNTATKKTVNVTRADVVSHLKAIGFDVSSAQPASQIKEIEMQAAAFLVVMNYVLPLAQQDGIEKELSERIKFMAS